MRGQFTHFSVVNSSMNTLRLNPCDLTTNVCVALLFDISGSSLPDTAASVNFTGCISGSAELMPRVVFTGSFADVP